MRARSVLIFLFGALALVAHSQEDLNPDEEPYMSPEEELADKEEKLDAEKLKAVHDAMDANKDGKVSKVEMHEFTKKIRLESSKRDTSGIIAEIDKDGDGKVSESEYFSDMDADTGAEEMSEEDKAEQKRYNELEKAKFKASDKNKDGFLDADELPVMMNPELYDDLLKLVADNEFKNKDMDGNGQLTQKEFFQSGPPEDAESESGPDAQMQEEFFTLDKDSSGTLSLKEYEVYESGTHQTEAAIAKILELADKDKDGHVTADEFTGSPELHDDSEVHSHMWEWHEALTHDGGEL